VYINYNKRLNARQLERKLQCKDLDPIATEEINYNSEWLTGEEGAANEWVYGEEGLTWATIEDAMGVNETDAPSTRTYSRGTRAERNEDHHEDEWPDTYMTMRNSDDDDYY